MTQLELDHLLRRGILFSILWLMGIGSAIAVYSGLKAKRAIGASGGVLQGSRRVWWCLIVGGLGIIIWSPLVVVAIANQF